MSKQLKKILIINQYFPPDASATAKMAYHYALKLAENHQVTVLCGRPSYNSTARHGYYLFRTDNITPHLTVIRVGSTAKDRSRMRDRVLNYLSYLILGSIIGSRLRPDVVVTMTDPPFAYLLGALLSRYRRKPFVYIIQDFHPDMAVEAGIVKDQWLVKIWDRLHRWALKKADKVVVLGEDMRERALAKGADSRKVSIVRSGAYFEDSNDYRPPNLEFVNTLRCGFQFVVGYAGNFGFACRWETLVKAIRTLSNDDIGFVLIGEGPEKPRLMELLNGNNVKFFPFQPEQELLSVLSVPDVHLVLLRRGLEGLVVPSKLYPILAMGKPVIALVPKESDVSKIVADHRCGIAIDPDDPDRLVEAIRYLAAHPEILENLGKRAKVASSAFSMEVSLRNFEEIVTGAYNTWGRAQKQLRISPIHSRNR